MTNKSADLSSQSISKIRKIMTGWSQLQYTIQVGDKPRRRPDLIAFVNGLPIGILEFKNPTDSKATLKNAYTQVTNRYRNDIQRLLRYNEIIGLADLHEARIGLP